MKGWIEFKERSRDGLVFIQLSEVLRINDFPQVILKNGKCFVTAETYDELKAKIEEATKDE